MPLCGLLALAVSGCGGGDGGGTAQPLENLYCFGSSSTDAAGPDGGLFQGSDGNFYGTTSGGGIGGGTRQKGFPYNGDGTVFKIAPTGEETVLHLFAGAPADGVYPRFLIQGSDGSFYGTTGAGGVNNAGTVFKLTPEGVETILHSFTGGSDSGALGLVQGSDGNFYGTTANGYGGIVFKLTPEGVLTTLHTFTGVGGDGSSPTGGLLQGSDGSIYGLTNAGGDHALGTVFKVTSEGIETILHSFSGPPADAASPAGMDSLIQGSDGNFYGTTLGGGAHDAGTVFKLTPEGVETILYSFTGGSDGAEALGLIQGSDGNFYGTASSGGMNYGGTIFQLTPTGAFTGLYSFSVFPESSQPLTNLLQGSDGDLYGTTYQGGGGANQAGCFFRFLLK
jgi:uncharacterized repeat protein (TIGR03803 family)